IMLAKYLRRLSEGRELLKRGTQKNWSIKTIPFCGCSLTALEPMGAQDGGSEQAKVRFLLCVASQASFLSYLNVKTGNPKEAVDRDVEIVENNRGETLLLIDEQDVSFVLYAYPKAWNALAATAWR
ncbi:MAG TPA: hypothetical protein V6D17_16145, partial [Candidatus Obscuribacterales bacterium]